MEKLATPVWVWKQYQIFRIKKIVCKQINFFKEKETEALISKQIGTTMHWSGGADDIFKLC